MRLKLTFEILHVAVLTFAQHKRIGERKTKLYLPSYGSTKNLILQKMDLTEEENQILWKELREGLFLGKEFKQISVNSDCCIFQYPIQISPQEDKNIYTKISFKAQTFSLIANLNLNPNLRAQVLKIVAFFNKQTQLPNFKYFYNPDSKTLTSKGIFNISPVGPLQRPLFFHQFQLMARNYEDCLRKIYQQTDYVSNSRNQPKNRISKEKERSYLKFLGHSQERIDCLRNFILKEIQSRTNHYTLKPLDQPIQCQLFPQTIGSLSPSKQELSKEDVQKINKVIHLIFQKRKKNESVNKGQESVLRMINIKDYQSDRNWAYNLTNNSCLEKIAVKCQIFNFSINSQANKAMIQLEKERQLAEKSQRKQEFQRHLKFVSRAQFSEKSKENQNSDYRRYLVVKKPTQEGMASYRAQIEILKCLREVSSNNIASYYVEEIEEPTHIPSKLFVDYYQRCLSQQKFDEKSEFFLAQHLAEGLGFLYNYSILHRDLKPSNIMVCQKGNPKIIDFGSAHSFNRSFLLQKKFLNPLRTTIKYNFFYHQLPKELKDSMEMSMYEQNKYFDMYSFGVLLFELMKLGDLSNRGGKAEYVWQNLRWVASHTALLNPNQRINPLHLTIFMNQLATFYLE